MSQNFFRISEVTPVSPDWMSDEGIHTLSSGYLLPGETPRDMMVRLASTAAKINQDPSLEDDLFHCLWSGWIGGSSPVCSNFGTPRGLPISCYSVHLSDSVSSIYSHLRRWPNSPRMGVGLVFTLAMLDPQGHQSRVEENRQEWFLGANSTI